MQKSYSIRIEKEIVGSYEIGCFKGNRKRPNSEVCKASMRTWMEYLHLQAPIDGTFHNETVTGVPVTLTAITSDGSVTDIGTVTTN